MYKPEWALNILIKKTEKNKYSISEVIEHRK